LAKERRGQMVAAGGEGVADAVGLRGAIALLRGSRRSGWTLWTRLRSRLRCQRCRLVLQRQALCTTPMAMSRRGMRLRHRSLRRRTGIVRGRNVRVTDVAIALAGKVEAGIAEAGKVEAEIVMGGVGTGIADRGCPEVLRLLRLSIRLRDRLRWRMRYG
jgi:hypothetical protein